eukprot:RCo021788
MAQFGSFASRYGANSDPNLIVTGVWLGSFEATRPETLRSLGITNVLSCAYELPYQERRRWVELQQANIAVKHIHWDDADDQKICPSPEMDEGLAWIDQILASGQQVLINCRMGISRSSSMVIAYLIHRKGYTYDSALSLVRSKRPIANPNPGFEQQLRQARPGTTVGTSTQQNFGGAVESPSILRSYGSAGGYGIPGIVTTTSSNIPTPSTSATTTTTSAATGSMSLLEKWRLAREAANRGVVTGPSTSASPVMNNIMPGQYNTSPVQAPTQGYSNASTAGSGIPSNYPGSPSPTTMQMAAPALTGSAVDQGSQESAHPPGKWQAMLNAGRNFFHNVLGLGSSSSHSPSAASASGSALTLPSPSPQGQLLTLQDTGAVVSVGTPGSNWEVVPNSSTTLVPCANASGGWATTPTAAYQPSQIANAGMQVARYTPTMGSTQSYGAVTDSGAAMVPATAPTTHRFGVTVGNLGDPSASMSFAVDVSASVARNFMGMDPSASVSRGYMMDSSASVNRGYVMDPSASTNRGYAMDPSASVSRGYAMDPSASVSRGYMMDPSASVSRDYMMDPSASMMMVPTMVMQMVPQFVTTAYMGKGKRGGRH